MKTIEYGGEIRRVSDEEAFSLVGKGWKFIPKKKKGKAFVCSDCGKKFRYRPESCNGDIVSKKSGAKEHSTCGCKRFSEQIVEIPSDWT